VTPPKSLEILAKTWISTFTHCPGHFLRFRLGKPLRKNENSPEALGNCEAIWRIRVQPLDDVVGQVFILKPRFSNSLPPNTPGRVLASDEIFVNRTYYYASEVSAQTLGAGDGTLVTFAGAIGRTRLRKGTVQSTTAPSS